MEEHEVSYQTINVGGFSAAVEAYARNPQTSDLWFLAMVGPQTSLKAIWASILKQPPDSAHIFDNSDELALVGDFRKCSIPNESLGTWTTRITRLQACGGYHAMVYTKMAEYAYHREDFLILAPTEAEAPSLHYTFLDRRVHLPIHPSWTQWLWARGIKTGEIFQLESAGIQAWLCKPNVTSLEQDLSTAISVGQLTVPPDQPTGVPVPPDGLPTPHLNGVKATT